MKLHKNNIPQLYLWVWRFAQKMSTNGLVEHSFNLNLSFSSCHLQKYQKISIKQVWTSFANAALPRHACP